MDTATVDREYEQLRVEFEDVAKAVQDLAEKMQAAAKAGDGNATAWLTDLEQVAQEIAAEQSQANTLLQAIHACVANVAQAQAEPTGEAGKPPLFAPGHEPTEQQPQGYPHRGGLFGGAMMGGPMMGGPFGGFLGGGFGQAMMMGGGISLGESLIGSIFRL